MNKEGAYVAYVTATTTILASIVGVVSCAIMLLPASSQSVYNESNSMSVKGSHIESSTQAPGDTADIWKKRQQIGRRVYNKKCHIFPPTLLPHTDNFPVNSLNEL